MKRLWLLPFLCAIWFGSCFISPEVPSAARPLLSQCQRDLRMAIVGGAVTTIILLIGSALPAIKEFWEDNELG